MHQTWFLLFRFGGIFPVPAFSFPRSPKTGWVPRTIMQKPPPVVNDVIKHPPTHPNKRGGAYMNPHAKKNASNFPCVFYVTNPPENFSGVFFKKVHQTHQTRMLWPWPNTPKKNTVGTSVHKRSCNSGKALAIAAPATFFVSCKPGPQKKGYPYPIMWKGESSALKCCWDGIY